MNTPAERTGELLVIARTYDLIQWACQHIGRFPRDKRFTLGNRLEHRLYDVLERLVEAKYTRERAPLLRAVNLDLELVRFQIRLAKDLRCLSLDSYGHAAKLVNEIGQMVGGWLKYGGKHEASRPPLGGTDELPQPAAGLPQGPPRQA